MAVLLVPLDVPVALRVVAKRLLALRVARPLLAPGAVARRLLAPRVGLPVPVVLLAEPLVPVVQALRPAPESIRLRWIPCGPEWLAVKSHRIHFAR